MELQEFNEIVQTAYKKHEWFIDIDEMPESVTEVEVGAWLDDGKYSYRYDVYKAGDNYFSISSARSGSYYTDYYYNEPEVTQVVPVEETHVVINWKGI